MNIEEERKAFIEACKDQFGNVYYPMNDDWSEGEFCDPVVQRHFVTWQLAKAHAVELAKPTCIVFETMAETFIVQYLDCGRLVRERGFVSEKHAIAWATNNGYRVVEE